MQIALDDLKHLHNSCTCLPDCETVNYDYAFSSEIFSLKKADDLCSGKDTYGNILTKAKLAKANVDAMAKTMTALNLTSKIAFADLTSTTNSCIALILQDFVMITLQMTSDHVLKIQKDERYSFADKVSTFGKASKKSSFRVSFRVFCPRIERCPLSGLKI